MRIGIVTFWKNNYGSALQAYATKRYLTTKGYEVDVLNERYFGVNRYKNYMLRKLAPIKYVWKYRGFLKYYRDNTRLRKGESTKLTKESSAAIDSFINRCLHPYECGYKQLTNYANDANTVAILAGSDQIWNCSKGFINSYYFLEFAPNDKKIGFAASFGTGEIPKYLMKDLKYSLEKFKNISVREYDGIKIIQNLLGIEVNRLADPTVLLSANEWREITIDCNMCSQRYIFVHFIDEPNDIALDTVKRISNLYNSDVICFGYYHESLKSIQNVIICNGGPEEYVNYIDKALIVLTDSFHSSLFSINMGTNFLIFNRQYKQLFDQNSRIKTLLKLYQYENHYIETKKQIRDLDCILMHDNTNELIKERRSLEKYLDMALPKIEKTISLKDKEHCTGCGACVVSCKVNAIRMLPDEFGFIYPQIDSSVCIDCGKCAQICSENLDTKVNYVKHAYVAYSSENKIRNEAASGGVFASLANYIIEDGGVVCGASMNYCDDRIKCEHILVDRKTELHSILGSKYVQSDCCLVFPQIKKILKEGRMVLFGGTSCQVAALYKYLGKKNIYNLLTVDLICHGVPSSQFFNDYVKYIEKKKAVSVQGFSFRKKTDSNIQYVETIKFGTGDEQRIFIPAQKSSYYRLFLMGESYRNSCYNCEYASLNKPADITVGDYFELNDDYPDLYNKIQSENGCGVSCIVTNTQKGEDWLSKSCNYLYKFEVDIKVVQNSHAQLCGPMKYSKVRKNIFEHYSKSGYESVEKFFMKRDIVRMIPRWIKHRLYR